MAQLRDFASKVALVTGGSTGIGRAAALLFARRGLVRQRRKHAGRRRFRVPLIYDTTGDR